MGFTKPPCPRCGGGIPNDRTPGAYPGAISRADNHTEVCSACGWDEAMRQNEGDGVQPVDAWPVERTYRLPVQFIESDDRDLLLQFGLAGDASKIVSVYTVKPGALQDPSGDGEAILVNEAEMYVLIPEDRLDRIVEERRAQGDDQVAATVGAYQEIIFWAREQAAAFLG